MEFHRVSWSFIEFHGVFSKFHDKILEQHCISNEPLLVLLDFVQKIYGLSYSYPQKKFTAIARKWKIEKILNQ